MRIVHLINYFQPTLGYQETHLARQQIGRGHEVTVVCSDRYYPFPDYDGSMRPLLGNRIVGEGAFVEEGIPVRRLPVRYESTTHRRCWMKGVEETLVELRPDVVHAHGVAEFGTVQAAWLQNKLGYKLIVDGHDMWVTVKRGLKGRAFYGLFRGLFTPLIRRHSTALVGVTDQSADIMRQVLGFETHAVSVIELGVDSDRFIRDEAGRAALRRQLGIADEDFVLLYTGKLVPTKDPALILQAMSSCPSHVKALFVGNGADTYVGRMHRIIDEHGLGDRVRFAPACPQAELPKFYSAADAACWPREASMAILEAASCSLPVVVVRGGLEARIANRNGLEYDEGDIEELASVFNSLADDVEAARAMGQRGRDLIERSFTWDRISLAFERLYENT